MKTHILILVIALTVTLFNACSKDKTSGTDGDGGTLNCSTITNKAFAADVNPIIQTSCATNSGCHGSGSVNGPGALTSYTAIFNARTSIRTAVANGTMPQNSTLSTSQKNSLLCWIDSGAPNN